MAKRGPKKKTLSNTDENDNKCRPGTSVGKYIGNCGNCNLILGKKDLGNPCPRCEIIVQGDA